MASVTIPHSLPPNSVVLAGFPCHGSAVERMLYMWRNSLLVLWDFCQVKFEDIWASTGLLMICVRFVGAILAPASFYCQVLAPFTMYYARFVNTTFHILQGPRYMPSYLGLQSLFSKHAPFDVAFFLSLFGVWRVNMTLELFYCAWTAVATAVLWYWYRELIPGVSLRGLMLTRLLVTLANIYLNAFLNPRSSHHRRPVPFLGWRRNQGYVAAAAAAAAAANLDGGCFSKTAAAAELLAGEKAAEGAAAGAGPSGLGSMSAEDMTSQLGGGSGAGAAAASYFSNSSYKVLGRDNAAQGKSPEPEKLLRMRPPSQAAPLAGCTTATAAAPAAARAAAAAAVAAIPPGGDVAAAARGFPYVYRSPVQRRVLRMYLGEMRASPPVLSPASSSLLSNPVPAVPLVARPGGARPQRHCWGPHLDLSAVLRALGLELPPTAVEDEQVHDQCQQHQYTQQAQQQQQQQAQQLVEWEDCEVLTGSWSRKAAQGRGGCPEGGAARLQVTGLAPRVLLLPPSPSHPSTPAAAAAGRLPVLRISVALGGGGGGGCCGVAELPQGLEGSQQRQYDGQQQQQQEASRRRATVEAVWEVLEVEVLVRSANMYLPIRVASRGVVRRDRGGTSGVMEPSTSPPLYGREYEYDIELLRAPPGPGVVLLELGFKCCTPAAAKTAAGGGGGGGGGGGDQLHRSGVSSSGRWHRVMLPILATDDAAVAGELSAAGSSWPARRLGELDELLYDMGTWTAAAAAAAGGIGRADGDDDVTAAGAVLSTLGPHLLSYADSAGLEATAARIRNDMRPLLVKCGHSSTAAAGATADATADATAHPTADATAGAGLTQRAEDVAMEHLDTGDSTPLAATVFKTPHWGRFVEGSDNCRVVVVRVSGGDGDGGGGKGRGRCGMQRQPWWWWLVLKRAVGLQAAPPDDAAAFRAFVDAWTDGLSHIAKLPRLLGFCASKGLLLAGLPAPSGAAAYAGGPGMVLLEGVILPGVCLVSPCTAFLISCLRLLLNYRSTLLIGAATGAKTALLTSATVELLAVTTTLACHFYLRCRFDLWQEAVAAAAAAEPGGVDSCGSYSRRGGGCGINQSGASDDGKHAKAE
ncbi:hypothetical protein VOLCADRAFT_103932 [Volvox carteri f. nagariensis]|uniref:Uncharacterized protein n=1 Tax=Volvox carteri f. nagariensis TaxID=3068 RepID=D8TQ54_VOLCA|nr:uncharacterized protein VOLCADRAFT_103932 [Volvox carteri f. nagariensis]EFJ50346.1 hypothetical protein VOLCADRAFT_103932 [Volvox carteri f. nagariensis]|eukprot:XP_002948471.1 hypothetical protein VOLCADRAFT_103932 [Volvox carteri f. nagariensis]